MDALIAKADAIRPLSKKRKAGAPAARPNPKAGPSTTKKPEDDATAVSVSAHALLPRSLRPSSPPPDEAKKYGHIQNKRLRTQLSRQSAQNARNRRLAKDTDLLLMEDAGALQVETEIEKTWRVGQSDIEKVAGEQASRGRQEWKLDGGPYCTRYTRNGRHIALVGKKGHVATFDWQAGTLHTELQLRETCRDITFLQDHSHFAVAQKQYVFIYDRDGVELHKLKSHIEPTRLEFLPYHWLLASVGNAGYLKYQDTSTGQLVVEHRTKLGACHTMCQNPHNAVIHLGHQNGTVTLWTPNLPHPAVRLLAHLGPVASVSVDPSSGGRYMASAGQDGTVKVWDCRSWKGAVRTWNPRGGSAILEWSQRGALGVATGGSVNVYMKPAIQNPFPGVVAPPLYLTHPVPHRPLTSVRFCPFQDVLTIGHQAGVSGILVPGVGEPNFDSSEADPFENKKARREREVKGLLDKIQPDAIALDPDFVGSLAPPPKLSTAVDGAHDVPFARLPRHERLRVMGKADETEEADGGADDGDNEDGDGEGKARPLTKAEKEKRKMRGKNKSLKRYLRKQRKNVIDPRAVAVRTRLERERAERRKARAVEKGEEEPRKPSALDRFKRPS
ncbi:BING4CT-domain-containing protein [Epithele typhae]|uniref:BING4CT-domain-containing protein n=1 Tax=Epithele typhae TaxID=378194 RepID=UPI0020084E1A|nr:BING4CT-domain-containing protein [Epithele typhae]KAH9914178.1 BING4CT-domain-containing protein [Epithele typhae]